MERPRLYAFIAAALLFCCATIEIVMVITDHWWTRFGPRHNDVVGLILADAALHGDDERTLDIDLGRRS